MSTKYVFLFYGSLAGAEA